MTVYDVFNGDADGICALVQLRRADPRSEARCITGVKRDIALLEKIEPSAGDILTVLDISMKRNGKALRRLLNAGADVFYVDHHNPGDIPDHSLLDAVIDTRPTSCTALIVNTILENKYRAWAVTAAFGDNFPAQARDLGQDLPLETLQDLGTLINYNAYGGQIDDLHFHPKTLYEALVRYETPMAFLQGAPEIYQTLKSGYQDDLRRAKSAQVIDNSKAGQILNLGSGAAVRRISGVYGNGLVYENTSVAHAILTEIDGGFLVSVRAPLENRIGADTLCLQFETGGGRAAAAGINVLPAGELDRFIAAFRTQFTR